MEKALIIINAEVNEQGKLISASPVTEKMVIALKKGIATSSPDTVIETVSAGSLWSKNNRLLHKESNTIYCPLTIQLPDYFDFPSKEIYAACKDIGRRRHWVEQNLGYKTSVGDSWLGHLWLPILLTRKGLLYADIIGEGAIPNSYEQPVKFSEKQRHRLCRLASNLLESLSATPAVYLLQFSLHNQEIVFDRLWPFPAAPALASLRANQQADLFSCHWRCLTGQSLLEWDAFNAQTPIF